MRHSRHNQSAWVPLVIHIFDPLITHSSPSRTARVRMPATSDPASGSETAIEVTISPAMAGRRYRSFSSGLPKRCSAGVAMSVCTASAMDTPERGRPSDLLAEDHRVGVVGSPAAVLRVVLEPEQAELAEAAEHLVRREVTRLLPLVGVGVDLA